MKYVSGPLYNYQMLTIKAKQCLYHDIYTNILLTIGKIAVTEGGELLPVI